jgi:D-aminopeptidase
VLTIDGAPVGKELGRFEFREPVAGLPRRSGLSDSAEAAGSCMIVVATDAPLTARDLKRLAARAIFGLARTGSSYSNGSGDFAIAFSTARAVTPLPTDALSPLFQAALEATEEAVYNSLLRATSVTGNETTVEAIPIPRVREILKKYGRGQ